MRVTTNMIMRNYQTSLSNNISSLTEARNAVLTGRRFTKASEDPGAALTASSLERRLVRNGSHLTTITEVQSRQDAQEDAVMQLNKISQTIDRDYSVSVLNGTNLSKDVRATYATTLRELQRSMVSSLNAQYGDEFVLTGAAGREVPFKIQDDGRITYRNIDLATTDPDELAKLKEMSQESTYVDIGFGLSFEKIDMGGGVITDGDVVSSSAFNTSLPGINIVGYGPDNMLTTIGKMADALEADTFNREEYEGLWTKFQKGASQITDVTAKLGTKTTLLESTKSRLTDLNLSLTSQIDSIVNIDPAEAIMNFSWANYTYTTALKIGTNIISSSLLDFMK